MSSLEEEHNKRSQMLVKHNLSDDELDILIKKKIEELEGYIDARAAMVLINKELAQKKGQAEEPLERDPEQDVRNKIVKELEKRGRTLEDLDLMITALQEKSVYVKKNKMLAYELIAKQLGVVILEDRETQARTVELTTVPEALDMPYKENTSVRGIVIAQRVQRKKGGDWTKLYTTAIADESGQVLTMKTAKRDNADFSHLFLQWGNWYNFYGINRTEGNVMQDQDGNPRLGEDGEEQRWDDTWWWSGESELLHDVRKSIPGTLISQMNSSYETYILSGVVSNYRPLRDWSLYNPYTDNFEKSQSVNQPADKKVRENHSGEQTTGEDGLYLPWSVRHRMTISTPNDRIEVSTRGFDMGLAAWQRIGDANAQRKLKLRKYKLDGCRVTLYGSKTKNPNTNEELFMAHGILTIEESGAFDGVQALLDNILGEMLSEVDEPKNDVPVDSSADHIQQMYDANEPTPPPNNQGELDQVEKERTELSPVIIEKIKVWYMEYIKTRTIAVAFPKFKKDLWLGIGWKGPDDKVSDAINMLINEGLVREWKGAMIYPNN